MSFINAFFLAALGTAVLPVLFHLIRQVRAKKVVFSSLMFLKATPKELVRRRRLRDLLLMAVRASIFALLALMFARPFIPKEAIPFIPQREDQSVVLLIDNSYSMQYGDGLAAAEAQALALLDGAAGNDEFALIVFSDTPQQITTWSQDRDLHRNALTAAYEPSYRITDFYEPLRLAEEVLADAQHAQKKIVLISDFQQNGWGGSFENWKLGEDILFETISVADGARENAYFTSFNLNQKRIGDDVVLRYDARVYTPTNGNRATLALDTESLEEQALPADEASPFAYQQVAPRNGFFQGELTLVDDGLGVDNTQYFTFSVSGRPQLLVIDEAPSSSLRDAFYLENAFALGESALYAFSAGGRGRLAASSVRDQGVIFLTNVASLTSAQRNTLKGYVEEGGTVVYSFGNRVDMTAARTLFAEWGIGQVDRQVNARALIGSPAIIGEVDLRHPIFNLFQASGTGAIFRPTFREYVRIAPDSSTVVLGSYDSNDPFLLERRMGRGNVLVYTSTFSAAWTDFPVNELYVPFVYQLARYGLGETETQHLYTVGEAVALEGRPGEEWDVQGPGNTLRTVSVGEAGTAFFRETEVPGHYVASNGREQVAFSVNVDVRESDLAMRDANEAYAAVVPPTDPSAADPALAAALEIEAEERNQKLWRYVLLLIIGLFIFETVYANRPFKQGSAKKKE